MRLAPGLYMIDLGAVNAYVWERPDGGLTLIDAGMPNSANTILHYVADLGLDRLDRIIVTHGDVDHIGALAAVRTATGASVICHAVEKDLVEGKTPRRPAPGLPGTLITPLYGLLFRTFLRYERVPVDELVLDRQTLPESLQVVHVPGHTAGQIALYEPARGILIAADALGNRRDRLARPATLFTPQMSVAEDSIRKLADLPNVQLACFGHGPAITENASVRLQEFAATL